MKLFTTNPVLYRIRYMNRETLDVDTGVKAVVGKAMHKALEVYYGGGDEAVPLNDEGTAIALGLKAGTEFLDEYPDGFIRYNATIKTKARALEVFAFGYNAYVAEHPYTPDRILGVEEEIKMRVHVQWEGKDVDMPVPLKGFIDRVERVDGRIEVRDYKTTDKFSNPEKIDGAKMLQAVSYYLLAYAKYGEAPRRMYFDEIKYTKNQDGGKQTQSYCVEYDDCGLFFHFFFRLYEDINRALNGEAVYVPNLDALYDNEVALIAYVHGLDLPEKVAELKKKHRTDDIGKVLARELNNSAYERKFLEALEKSTTLAKAINYDNMTIDERIRTKLMEHGIVLRYDSTVEGAAVDLYRYAPSVGVKMSRLRNYVEDVEQVLGVTGVRVLAPIPKSTLIGFEVPRETRTFPTMPEFDGHNIAIGQRSTGECMRYDLRDAPHTLVAGASGSGKSVWLANTIRQLAAAPDVQLWLVDPKRVELGEFKAQAARYETDVEGVRDMLADLTAEMHRRYEVMRDKSARKIADLKGKARMPYIYVIVDEYGDLITGKHTKQETVPTGEIYAIGALKGQPKYKTTTRDLSSEIEAFLLGLAQMARAAGIHMVIATQRPSTDVVKGTIKANFPCKVLFRTAKAIDSTVVIDEAGAEKLLGKGDMLFGVDGSVERLQGYAAA